MCNTIMEKQNSSKDIKLTNEEKIGILETKQNTGSKCARKNPVESNYSKLSGDQIKQLDGFNEYETSYSKNEDNGLFMMDEKVVNDDLHYNNFGEMHEKRMFHPKTYKEKKGSVGNNPRTPKSISFKYIASNIVINSKQSGDTLILDKCKLRKNDELYDDIDCKWEQKCSDSFDRFKSAISDSNCSCTNNLLHEDMFCDYIMCRLSLTRKASLSRRSSVCKMNEVNYKNDIGRNKFNVCCCNYKNINKDISNIERNFRCCQEYKKDIDLLVESHLEGNCRRKHKNRLDYLCELAYFEYLKSRYGKCCKINRRILTRLISQKSISFFECPGQKCDKNCIFDFCCDTYCSQCNICVFSSKQDDGQCEENFSKGNGFYDNYSDKDDETTSEVKNVRNKDDNTI